AARLALRVLLHPEAVGDANEQARLVEAQPRPTRGLVPPGDEREGPARPQERRARRPVQPLVAVGGHHQRRVLVLPDRGDQRAHAAVTLPHLSPTAPGTAPAPFAPARPRPRPARPRAPGPAPPPGRGSAGSATARPRRPTRWSRSAAPAPAAPSTGRPARTRP